MASRPAMDMDAMLQKIKDRQWALADIDWDAPGVETISDEFRPKLKAFMADLCWIENVGARGFAAMATKAPTPTIAEIYRYFHAEEQRHANAELALLKRWGMLEEGEIPEPSVNIRLAIEWLDKYADDMPLSVLGTVIPMLEVALDGALLQFLLEEVHDPVCHQVFEKINNDESRHIAVDFEVLNMIGHAKARKLRDRVRRQRRLARADHRRPDVRAAAQPDAQQHHRDGPPARAPVRRHVPLHEARGARRVHAPGAALPGAEVALRDGDRPEAPLPPGGQLDGVAEREVPAPAAAADPHVVQGADLRAGQLHDRQEAGSRRPHDPDP